MGLFSEFKTFAMRGNVMDLAVGVVIGGAFGLIINSLVGDVIMPIIGIFTGGINFSGLSYSVNDAVIAYGKFIQSIISFGIITFALFIIIKGMNAAKVNTVSIAPPPTPEELLLAEIRDLLKNQKN
jgi:large conductance mechanosensitive channel